MALVLLAVPQTVASNASSSKFSANQKAFWKAAMASSYGPYSKQHKCWIGKKEGEQYCMRPTTFSDVEMGSRHLLFASMGGSKLDENGGLEDYHAAAGYSGYVVFEAKASGLKEVARSNLFWASGGMGNPPSEDDVAVRKIGPDAFAWFVISGYGNQGYFATHTTIFAPVGDKVAEVGDIPNASDDSGACEKDACTNLQTEILIDTAKEATRFYPLVVKVTGTSEGKPESSTFQVPFEDSKLEYAVPKGLSDLVHGW
ncbi:hypothetical protein [Aestuariivirga litoralis]|uniref:hypothetical protein n=1 Tax=Aestuariivirga litoralis TaxID=2650924 RepID=UPI0018C7EE4A|nr:hypothetical protein [Aestuariivirga litoralis]MBG1232144.1 hypothetical protein [Aestuariivirga litoralis]